MAKMTREQIRQKLVNAGTLPDVATIYAHAFAEYSEAMQNIQTNGAVVANPRTGAPIDNPFLKVRDRAEAKLTKLGRRVKGASDLWGVILESSEQANVPQSNEATAQDVPVSVEPSKARRRVRSVSA